LTPIRYDQLFQALELPDGTMSENHEGEIDAVHDSPLYDMREGWL